MMKDNKVSLERHIKKLEEENKLLRKKLEWEEIRNLIYQNLLEIAEENLEIELEKKQN